MNLYVTGFNAWRQLEFLSLETSTEEPDDIASFRKVLSDKLIEIHYISLTCTIVVTSAGLQYAGSVDDSARLVLEQRRLSFMTAVAGNGVIAVYDGHDRITQHASLPQSGETEAGQIFNGMHKIIQLVACETSFVALSADGKVWTWGDERYSATLGRDITISSPAERPSLVEDLEDLPSGKIKKIAAGGYTVFALTDGHDLYAWGGHPARRPIPETLSGSPSPLDVEENDIVDCAVGEAHMIVLTTKGDVYVAGDNTNGQLGLSLEKTANWRKVPMPPRGEDIIGVKAGQRSSFIVTKSSHLSNFHLGLL